MQPNNVDSSTFQSGLHAGKAEPGPQDGRTAGEPWTPVTHRFSPVIDIGMPAAWLGTYGYLINVWMIIDGQVISVIDVDSDTSVQQNVSLPLRKTARAIDCKLLKFRIRPASIIDVDWHFLPPLWCSGGCCHFESVWWIASAMIHSPVANYLKAAGRFLSSRPLDEITVLKLQVASQLATTTCSRVCIIFPTFISLLLLFSFLLNFVVFSSTFKRYAFNILRNLAVILSSNLYSVTLTYDVIIPC